MGQKGEVGQNKERPAVSLSKEDRKTETMQCYCGGRPTPLGSSTCGVRSPSTQQANLRSKLLLFHRATKDVRETKVKGQAKHLEKPKSSLSLTTRRPFITNTRFQIHLPSGASPHSCNSMTHRCLLSRHCENKRQTDSTPKAQPFREQLGFH